MKGSVPFEAVEPRTPDGEVDAAGDVDAAGEVELDGDDAVLGDEDVDGVDECVAPWTPLVAGAVFVVELLTVELFVTELFVVLLLVTLVFVDELVLLLVVLLLDGVVGVDGVLVELQLEVLKFFTACQSRQCRLPGHGWTMCGWLLPGPRSIVLVEP